MQRYDFMILPTAQVLPFDIEQRYVTEINGVRMETYIDWMKSCYYVSTIGHPALSVPCGFVNGLPVGVQIVGRDQDDLGVLQLTSDLEGSGFEHRGLSIPTISRRENCGELQCSQLLRTAPLLCVGVE